MTVRLTDEQLAPLHELQRAATCKHCNSTGEEPGMSGRVTCTVCLGESVVWHLKLESALAENAEALLEQASEANRLERELARAMGIVTSALEFQAEGPNCLLCSRGGEAHVVSWHAADCPLVTGGFIDREGRRAK